LDHFGIVTQGDALGLLGSHRWCWEEMGGLFGSHRWCWEEIGGFFHDLALGGESADFFLVPGKGEALAEFHQNAFDLAQDGAFQIGLAVGTGEA
jgi:hypothetical protein